MALVALAGRLAVARPRPAPDDLPTRLRPSPPGIQRAALSAFIFATRSNERFCYACLGSLAPELDVSATIDAAIADGEPVHRGSGTCTVCTSRTTVVWHAAAPAGPDCGFCRRPLENTQAVRVIDNISYHAGCWDRYRRHASGRSVDSGKTPP